MPCSCRARTMRTAISPRLATKTLPNMNVDCNNPPPFRDVRQFPYAFSGAAARLGAIKETRNEFSRNRNGDGAFRRFLFRGGCGWEMDGDDEYAEWRLSGELHVQGRRREAGRIHHGTGRRRSQNPKRQGGWRKDLVFDHIRLRRDAVYAEL